MENMQIYEAVRKVPKEAQRKIEAGRLKGKTDINPMWRIKTLTEQFGVAGFGWYTETTRKWIERNENTGEAIANVDINLYIKIDGEWSKPIEGTGGAMFISNESKGIYTDDDAYKKAYTDAISVACKAIGMAGDIYWDKDPTKYTQIDTDEEKPQDAPESTKAPKASKNTTDTTKTQQSEKLGANEPKQNRAELLIGLMNDAGIPNSVVIEYMKAHHEGMKVAKLNDEDFGKLMNYVGDVAKRWKAAEELGEVHNELVKMDNKEGE